MRLEKVKTLISEGKTQQAIDLLQEILKAKNAELLNQTFLLENQFKELQKKMQLGLQDASAELNRINFTLLGVCDDAANLSNIGDDASDKPFSDDEKPTGLLANPLVIFGILAAAGVAIFVGIVVLSNSLSKKSNVVKPLPLPTPSEVESSKGNEVIWVSTTLSAIVTDKTYGSVKAEVSSVKAKNKDANTKILTLDLKLNCLSHPSSTCNLKQLEFRLVLPDGDKDAPMDDVVFTENPKGGQTGSNKVSFIVPKNVQQADFQIYYRDKLTQSLATIQLNQPH